MPTPAVELRSIVKRFGSHVAVDHFNLTVEKGELLSLLGPSGCGKTTTLRIIAGFVEPDEGEVLVMGENISSRPPHQRDMGMVYQSYALFPHMTVFDNVAYGLRMRKMARDKIEERVASVLELVHLRQMAERHPNQLSGGQQQRVALARAIAIEPKVLLLDEPLSNLDAKLRREMQVELRDLQRRLGITTIYVTHDQEEALTLSDRIVVMNSGRVMQIGEPHAIYRHPANSFVSNFIGITNILRGRIAEVSPGGNRAVFVSEGGLRCTVVLDCAQEGLSEGVSAAIRPEQVQFRRGGDIDTVENLVHGTISHVVYLGARTGYYVVLSSGERIIVDVQNVSEATARQAGDPVLCCLPPESLRLVADSAD
ncbi:MAG: ABC transporter ATP-binding protein [Candidatus Methylomirabilota bacterium]|jgi:putative spermidine/putrescine transport system ATP-binding protein